MKNRFGEINAALDKAEIRPGSAREQRAIELWLCSPTDLICRCGSPMRRWESFTRMCERCFAEWEKKHQEKPDDRYVQIQIPQRYQGCRLSSWNGDLPNGYADWIIRPQHTLLILGPVGTGKTHLATAALYALADEGIRSTWSSARLLPAELAEDDKTSERALWRHLSRVRVLLIDDLGAGREPEWQTALVKRLIEERYVAAKPTIITANATAKTLYVDDPRIGSRILEGATVITLSGKDRRIA